MMKTDYSMLVQLELKIIYTLSDQKIYTKDTEYENRRSITTIKGINLWTQSKNYGDKIQNHCNIAKLWTAYLDKEITAHDAAVMMALLKVARTKFGQPTSDTYVDAAAYMAIAGECKHENDI